LESSAVAQNGLPLAQPSESSSKNIDVSYQRFAEWIQCFCVVTFDLELGQSLEVTFPEPLAECDWLID
jgi:hypothetical protein